MKIGLPLEKPITQSVLPIVVATGTLVGFVSIASQEFTASPSPVVLADGQTYEAQSVTLPYKGEDGTGLGLAQYMAMVYSLEEAALQPWMGLPYVMNPQDLYYSWYSQPTIAGLVHHFDRGALLNGLTRGLDLKQYALEDGPSPPEPEVPTDGTQSWAATVNMAMLAKLTFFDFNWLNLFMSKLPEDKRADWAGALLLINPAQNSTFKAVLVQGLTGLFDTVRIIKLKAAEPGFYTFSFLALKGQAAIPCNFVLMVIA